MNTHPDSPPGGRSTPLRRPSPASRIGWPRRKSRFASEISGRAGHIHTRGLTATAAAARSDRTHPHDEHLPQHPDRGHTTAARLARGPGQRPASAPVGRAARCRRGTCGADLRPCAARAQRPSGVAAKKIAIRVRDFGSCRTDTDQRPPAAAVDAARSDRSTPTMNTYPDSTAGGHTTATRPTPRSRPAAPGSMRQPAAPEASGPRRLPRPAAGPSISETAAGPWREPHEVAVTRSTAQERQAA